MQKLKIIIDTGLILSKRDPLMNTLYAGEYMITAPYPAGHTQVSMLDPGAVWCMVWDDLDELIETVYCMLGVKAEDEAAA